MSRPAVDLRGALPVGEPFKILNFWPTVVIQCQCDKKSVLVLIGTDNVVTCPACQGRYVIADQMAVSVGALAKEGAEVLQ
jgi:hypothetical protein